jgi:hypothetical protein
VAHLSSLVMLSAGAIAEMKEDFDEVEQELRAQAAGQLRASGAAWEFELRQGIIADELIAAATAIRDAHPGETVTIMVGSSSHATHRVVGSVAIGLARHSPVPLIIVPERQPSAETRDRERQSPDPSVTAAPHFADGAAQGGAGRRASMPSGRHFRRALVGLTPAARGRPGWYTGGALVPQC